jgi:precorrin-2 dehydrogenase / sirohydrochlorin ferrochelatase
MSGRVLVPVLLDLTGLRVLFVGAGEGTHVKLRGLVDQNPAVRIVSPEISEAVRSLAASLSDAQIEERPFTEADLEGISLVYGMASDEALNTRLAELCLSRGIWSNVAHNRAGGSFSSPATARKDGVIAAFSSDGAHPALAVTARDAWKAD